MYKGQRKPRPYDSGWLVWQKITRHLQTPPDKIEVSFANWRQDPKGGGSSWSLVKQWIGFRFVTDCGLLQASLPGPVENKGTL